MNTDPIDCDGAGNATGPTVLSGSRQVLTQPGSTYSFLSVDRSRLKQEHGQDTQCKTVGQVAPGTASST